MIADLSTTDFVRMVTVIASIIASFRIITYRRQGRFKRSVSLVAWALAFFMGAQAISVAFEPSSSPGFYQAGIALFVAVAICRSRGNVSKLLRCD